jgi:hypothetical protein
MPRIYRVIAKNEDYDGTQGRYVGEWKADPEISKYGLHYVIDRADIYGYDTEEKWVTLAEYSEMNSKHDMETPTCFGCGNDVIDQRYCHGVECSHLQ